MDAAAQDRAPGRGPALLIAHCDALDDGRKSVRDRLHRLLGPELARLLVAALAGDHRMWSRRLGA